MKHPGLALLAILATSRVCAATPLSADDILRIVETKGPRDAVSILWRSPETTQQFLAGVRAADARWLEVARAIAPGADAGASEELNDALAVALIAKPYDVLPWLRTHWWGGSTSVCVFGYDSELPGGVDQYIGQLKVALAGQAPHGLSTLRSQCLTGLEETRKALQVAPHD